MSNIFDVAAGTATGYSHVLAGTANQDAYAIRTAVSDSTTIMVVADGCSEGHHSEVGARVGANVCAEGLRSGLWSQNHMAALRFARGNILSTLRTLTDGMVGYLPLPGVRSKLIRDHFLFTLVVGIVGPELSTFAAIGDGFLSVNGEALPGLGPFPKNQPPYLAYELTNVQAGEDALQWKILRSLPTADLQSFVVGTDGVRDLVDAESSLLPRTEKPVGPLSQFWTDDAVFRNPDLLRRRLVLCNGGIGPRATGGLLPDDTTLVVGRRIP